MKSTITTHPTDGYLLAVAHGHAKPDENLTRIVCGELVALR
jgi:hypothetical protein